MFGKIHFSHSIAFLAILILILSACLPTPPALGGIVQGAVYSDTNGNGVVDAGEGTLEGAEVTLSDCGAAQTQLTLVDGTFHFTNLPEGTCHVSVAKAGWIFSGSYPALGTYPIPVASDPELPTAFSMFMAPVMDFIPTDTPMPVPGTSTDTPIPGTPSFTPTLVPSATLGTPMVTAGTEDANCRFGPATTFLSVGGLKVGNTVPILATLADHSWWQIDNSFSVGTKCWVSAAVTTTSGDLSLVPIIAPPQAQVTNATISTPAVVHGYCGGPNATNFVGSITTNGPVKVIFHWEIYQEDGTWLNTTSDETMTFAAAGTQTDDPGAYKRDCGEYTVKLVILSPNAVTATASWSVVEP